MVVPPGEALSGLSHVHNSHLLWLVACSPSHVLLKSNVAGFSWCKEERPAYLWINEVCVAYVPSQWYPPDDFCVVQVCLQPLWSPLQMWSKQGYRWQPEQARPPTAALWTVLPRSCGKKVQRLSGKEQEVCKRALIAKWFLIEAFVTQELSSFLSSSCISIFSSVWCNSGDLWATAEMVLCGLWRSVSMWYLNIPGILKLLLVLLGLGPRWNIRARGLLGHVVKAL